MKAVDDILRKMRDFAETDSQSIGRDVLRREIHNFADRIEAAHNREVAELRKENARLRAALKPMLDIEKDIYSSRVSMELAITEANRIYNGEREVKE